MKESVKAKHNPLPWKISEDRKRIADVNDNTVAKLTSLDLPNAELIVKSVNSINNIAGYIE